MRVKDLETDRVTTPLHSRIGTRIMKWSGWVGLVIFHSFFPFSNVISRRSLVRSLHSTKCQSDRYLSWCSFPYDFPFLLLDWTHCAAEQNLKKRENGKRKRRHLKVCRRFRKSKHSWRRAKEPTAVGLGSRINKRLIETSSGAASTLCHLKSHQRRDDNHRHLNTQKLDDSFFF